jgi:hypothetical protein
VAALMIPGTASAYDARLLGTQAKEPAMAETKRPCPKCNAAMERGFVVDYSYGARLVSTWIEGVPLTKLFGGAQVKNRRAMEITANRCTKCGFLEMFAI